MRPPRPCGSPAAPASGGALMPPPQTTQRVRIVVPSASVDVPGRDLGHRDARGAARTPLRPQHLRDVVVRLVGERAEQRVAEVDDVHLRAPTPRGRGTRRSSSRGSGRPARRPVSTPVGPPPTTTKFSAPSLEQRRVAVGVLEHAEDARAQARGVVERSRAGRRARRRPACGRSSAASRRRARRRRRRTRAAVGRR